MADIASITAELMPTVKMVVRATSDVFDPEVEAVIAAALADLVRVGVSEECFDSSCGYWPIVKMAVITYAKAHFGADNPNAEMDFWRESWLMHVDALLNSSANVHATAEEEEG